MSRGDLPLTMEGTLRRLTDGVWFGSSQKRYVFKILADGVLMYYHHKQEPRDEAVAAGSLLLKNAKVFRANGKPGHYNFVIW